MSAHRMTAGLRGVGGRLTALAVTTAALLGASLALAPAALAASPVGAVTITAPATADEGDTLTVSIPVDTSADLFAYDLVVTFDPALLAFDDASATFPAGGSDSVIEGAGSVQFTHTRLGTSPGLAGAQTLATFTFTVLDGGATAIQLASATFVDSLGVSTPLAAPVSASVTLVAAPVVVVPSPSASATATPTPSASISGAPAVVGSSPAGSPLASTGSDLVVPLVVGSLAVALLALGAILVIRRRKEIVR